MNTSTIREKQKVISYLIVTNMLYPRMSTSLDILDCGKLYQNYLIIMLQIILKSKIYNIMIHIYIYILVIL